MKTLDLVQGSPEWLAARSNHFCASDAPAMMGASKKCTRNELIRLKATGDEREFSDWVQANLLDKGHEVEAKAREIIEQMIGEDLYPVTGTDDAGYLLASFDGITMDGTTGFEHKMWNEELAEAVRNGSFALPNGHHWQLEHQILVGGLDKVIFVCSDGTTDKIVYMEYRAVPGRAEQLLAGWKQFAEDVANYRPAEVLPPVVAAPVAELPTVSVQVNGNIAIVSNLDVFGQRLTAFIKGINTNPTEDQHFADAELAVKVLKEAQEALEYAEKQALSQTASIEELRSVVAGYVETARDTRLMLEKLVKSKKESIRGEILQKGKDAFAAHIASLNARLGKNYMPAMAVDFAGAMKGKRTIDSLRNAVDTELAKGKIEANAVADKIQLNLNTLRELAADYTHLFADTAQIVLKPNDDLTTLVKLRIAEHKEKEEKRLEQERERIRAEEAAKLAREAAADREADRTISATAVSPISVASVASLFEQAKTVQAQPASSKPSTVVPLKAAPSRPTDDQIIDALALNFRVHESTVIKWLLDMDLNAASERMVKEFTAA